MPSLWWFVARSSIAPLLLAAATANASEGPTDAPPPWAYGFKTPPPTNSDPAVATPAPAPTPEAPDTTRHGLPDTDRKFTRAEITDIYNPADYYPADHAVPPAIVAHGKSPVVWACARCHYYNGKGRPENAGLAGLPVEYFVAQMESFRKGERTSSDPRKPNTKMMADYARNMSDDDIRAAAEYFAAMPWTPWLRVVESERAPVTTVSAGMYLQVPGAGDEPLGDRIVEVPENPDAVEISRSPRIGFVAYVPVGSIRRGAELVTTGSAGKTMACTLCHGADLNGGTISGFGSIPGLAGRSPSYLARQLFDLKSRHRTGSRAILMQPVVANLSTRDLRDIAAYLASRPVPAAKTSAPTAP